MTESILHQLHAIAQANGLTAAAWARAANMPKQNLNAMLNGHREPRETTLIRLAEAAGATITIKNVKMEKQFEIYATALVDGSTYKVGEFVCTETQSAFPGPWEKLIEALNGLSDGTWMFEAVLIQQQ